WFHRSTVLQALAIWSNSSALAGRRFGSLRRHARTNSSTSRGTCSSARCDGGIGSSEIDIRRLDITMNQSHRVRFSQGAAYLTYQVHHARRRQRPEVADEGLEIAAIQQLHRVVEGAVAGQTEIEQPNRVGGRERGRCLRLALESTELARAIAEHLGPPSSLLERRPDIQAAEQNLIAANAVIGVAKAAYFPRISLTGLLGFESNQLSSLFTGETRTWQF